MFLDFSFLCVYWLYYNDLFTLYITEWHAVYGEALRV